MKINKYCPGSYDKASDFSQLNKLIEEHGSCNRLFYLALPPSVYESVTLNIKATCMAKGWAANFYVSSRWILTHCRLNELTHTVYWKILISVLGMSGYVIYIIPRGKQFANSGNRDQMPQSAASDLGLHCLPVTLLGVSWLQWVKHLFCQLIMALTHQGSWSNGLFVAELQMNKTRLDFFIHLRLGKSKKKSEAASQKDLLTWMSVKHLVAEWLALLLSLRHCSERRFLLGVLF